MVGDVTYKEDLARIKGKYGPENYSWLKKFGHDFQSVVMERERSTDLRIDGEPYYKISYAAQQAQFLSQPEFIAPYINTPMDSPFTPVSFHTFELVKVDQASSESD